MARVKRNQSLALQALDDSVGGPSRDLADAGNVRRTLYGAIKRRELSDLLRLYDFPDPTTRQNCDSGRELLSEQVGQH